MSRMRPALKTARQQEWKASVHARPKRNDSRGIPWIAIAAEDLVALGSTRRTSRFLSEISPSSTRPKPRFSLRPAVHTPPGWMAGRCPAPTAHAPSWRIIHKLPVSLRSGDHMLSIAATPGPHGQPFLLACLEWGEEDSPVHGTPSPEGARMTRIGTDAGWRMMANPPEGWPHQPGGIAVNRTRCPPDGGGMGLRRRLGRTVGACPAMSPTTSAA